MFLSFKQEHISCPFIPAKWPIQLNYSESLVLQIIRVILSLFTLQDVASSSEGGNNKYVQIFRKKASWKLSTCKEMGIILK